MHGPLCIGLVVSGVRSASLDSAFVRAVLSSLTGVLVLLEQWNTHCNLCAVSYNGLVMGL